MRVVWLQVVVLGSGTTDRLKCLLPLSRFSKAKRHFSRSTLIGLKLTKDIYYVHKVTMADRTWTFVCDPESEIGKKSLKKLWIPNMDLCLRRAERQTHLTLCGDITPV